MAYQFDMLNNLVSETLTSAEETIKYSERLLAEKDRLIQVLEERIRARTDSILETTNRQKELTIKHLEMQIKKLLKENEDLEIAVKAEICPKCETKFLLNENRENAFVSKSYIPPGKSSSALIRTSQSILPNRVKKLEIILDHKNGRINHLSKEVIRLTKTEKELTQKIYQLTKLLPMSRLPPSDLQPEMLKTTACSKPKLLIQDSEQTLGTAIFQNEVLFIKLQKLCSDLSELKCLFAFKNEELSHGLSSSVNESTLSKSESTLSETLSQEKLKLQSKLDVSKKYIDSLEKSIETLVQKNKINENIKKKIEAELQKEMTASQPKSVQEDLAGTKSVTNFLLSSCSRLEQLVDKEKTDRIQCVKELEVCQETIKNLTQEISSKNYITQRLDKLIDIMRSNGFNHEMLLEQLKKEVQWLADKVTKTETELYVYKEENCKMKKDINSMKRALMNEK